MAHKKGQGSSRNGRDSAAQRRGVKVYGGESVNAGSILVRQLGTVIHPGSNVRLGRDYTLYATVDGVVKYERLGKDRKKVSVYPQDRSGAAALEKALRDHDEPQGKVQVGQKAPASA